MVNEWPAILGSDGAGVVIEVGPDVTRLKVGDYVYSCAPVGQNRFTPFQDAYLAREDLLFKRGTNISLEDSCTIGTCLLVTMRPHKSITENARLTAQQDFKPMSPRWSRTRAS
jgi:NADPH:quinone reductase-like Zn-dependent oxidoreductase